MSSNDRSSQTLWTYALSSLSIVLLVGLLLRFFLITPFLSTGTAMAPALLSHDFIIAWKRGAPQRGRVVVYNCASVGRSVCARRLIGLPGDRVEFTSGQLILNGEVAKYEAMGPGGFVEEIWKEMRQVVVPSKMDAEPLIVPPGQVFVLDDNRSQSLEPGALISQEAIEGQAWRIWLSLDWFDNGQLRSWPKIRWRRLLREVH